MTDSEKAIIDLLREQNRLLRQLVEKDQPKYETKVDWPPYEIPKDAELKTMKGKLKIGEQIVDQYLNDEKTEETKA